MGYRAELLLVFLLFVAGVVVGYYILKLVLRYTVRYGICLGRSTSKIIKEKTVLPSLALRELNLQDLHNIGSQQVRKTMTDTYDLITLSYTANQNITLGVYYQINWPKKGKDLPFQEKSQLIISMRVKMDKFAEGERKPNVREWAKEFERGVLGRLLAIMGKNVVVEYISLTGSNNECFQVSNQ